MLIPRYMTHRFVTVALKRRETRLKPCEKPSVYLIARTSIPDGFVRVIGISYLSNVPGQNIQYWGPETRSARVHLFQRSSTKSSDHMGMISCTLKRGPLGAAEMSSGLRSSPWT